MRHPAADPAGATLPASLTVAEAQAIDAHAAETLGLPTLLLMENAAVNAAAVVLDLLAEAVELDEDRFRVGILAGGGSNGGDGWAMARHLLGSGVAATVFAVRPVEGLRGDAAVNAQAAVACGVPVTPCNDGEAAGALHGVLARQHVLVDAVLGTGLSGPPRAAAAGVIRVLNELSPRPPVLAIDVPSGLDADSGEPAEPTVRADLTVTFVAPKRGFAAAGAPGFTGRVVTAGIGVPDAALAAALPAASAPAAIR
ncbi:NAD(P)H-hydrate epimerase [Phycisphaera mikurensis]|uniref:NAD(P)H-hydrate epimerase n=1 Tax=Phycisphaera mikurensis (strain NBRC 102666 / KCTC 22515 / FYK2301M01) TaxID=1142394 RepID=I0IF71_PHYMF|nr:NAD(P)H-hydrate epimerase [Phycisphaera mikurensis]MBB6440695.1 NAD(P)H-hydrate epimerase [Phycisphaera mikurensis]BAM03909.1 hypothetical protein PSMK_17500 [Phycisphaera mikurensis NBRC 102666]